MSDFYILIDSSTFPISKSSYFGKSVVFWCAFWNNLEGKPYRAGFIYREKEGPHRIFFEGIIRALQDCRDILKFPHTVKIKGDDQTVINILNKRNKARELKEYNEQFIEIVCNYISKYGIKFEHEYLGESDATYRVVDKIAREFNRIFSDAEKIDDILEKLRENN